MQAPFQKAIEASKITPESILSNFSDSISEAISHVASCAKGSHIKKINFLLIGGAALHIKGLRDQFSDIDLLIENIELSTRMEQKLFRCSSGINVELFYDNKVTTIKDPRMFRRAIPLHKTTKNGIELSVGYYPIEYFLLMKMEMGREKCQADIKRILQTIPLQDLLNAFNELAKYNEKWVMSDLANMIVTDLIMLHLPGKTQGDNIHGLREFCQNINILTEEKRGLLGMVNLLGKTAAPKTKKACEASLSL